MLKLTVAVILLLGLSACGPGWSTSYSGKDEASNMILVNLSNKGEGTTFGPCGPARKLIESYSFDLRPIKQVYTDDEIDLMQTVDEKGMVEDYPRLKSKGTISFAENYSKVTININVLKEGRLIPFSGNGTHRLNREASDF